MTYNLIKRNIINILCLTVFVCSAALAKANVRIVAVNQSLNLITFKNYGAEQDIAAYRLCSNFNYTFSGMDGDANISVVSGDFLLSTDEEVTVQWTPATGFRAAGDDIGIYLPTGGFNTASAMVDFMQYLSPGNGRESVAVAKGIWSTGDFVTGGPYEYTGNGTENGVSFWTGMVSADGCTDNTAVNYDPAATNDDGSCLYAVTFNVDMNCETGFTEPAVEGPLFGWCGGCAPLADMDGDGIYSATLEIPAGDFEYKYAVDAFASQEDLIDDMVAGGTCAPVTDFFSFANRLITVSAGLVINDTYGTCGICDPSNIQGCTDPLANNYNAAAMTDDGSCLFDVTFNVDLSCYDGTDPNIDVNTPGGFTTIAIEGPSLGWCGSCVTLTDDGSDMWSVTLSLPAGPFEYKYAHDVFAGQEQLVDDMVAGGTCAPITDFDAFANREIIIPATLVTNDTYGSCTPCSGGTDLGCTDVNANNYDASAVTDDGSCLYDVTFNVDMNCYDGNDPNIDQDTPGGFTTVALEGPFFGWCGSCVTLVDDGSGIWSITVELPAGPFEYKYAHDVFAGQEQLIDDMLDGGTCAPITDFANFANREIIIPATLETNDTYGSCDACNLCPTDFDGDGVTDGDDFSIFLGNFGLPCSGPCPTDFDGNGVTNGDDFSIFLGNFGLPCD